MSYATTADIQRRMAKTLSENELTICSTLLDDAATIIDAYNPGADEDVKCLVSCKMVIRAMGDTGDPVGIPIGATQGSMSALGYSQSWTVGGGGVGELYLSKVEKKLLGASNRIGSYSPVEERVAEV